MNAIRCNLCDDPDTLSDASEVATVRSNVRRFQHERFAVWRCGSCRSIHARDEVELDRYYAEYPFHKPIAKWILRLVYSMFPIRLGRVGVRRHHRILDYGCGTGKLVHYLRSRGFSNVHGYDAYTRGFDDPAVLEERYDVLIAQDLVEHVDDPRGMLERFDQLVRPGGIVLVGTPNADAIDLSQPERHVHALHQPYHTHIFSKDALLHAGARIGWTLERLYMTQYSNTVFPFLNTNFGLHYARCFDNNIDVAFDPIRLNRNLLLTPRTPYLALFGYFRAPTTDITVIFRAPRKKL